MKENMIKNNIQPTYDGFYGRFGGQFLPDRLKSEFQKITEEFLRLYLFHFAKTKYIASNKQLKFGSKDPIFFFK